MTTEAPEDDRGVRTFVPTKKGDSLGIHDVPDIIKEYKPDCIYMTADPGTVTFLAQNTPDMPALAYTPIEGGPIPNMDWRNMLRGIPCFTTSKYGVQVVADEANISIPYIYHGVNHEVFRKVPGLREDVRKALGWEDKFVISMIATNVRRKQVPRLIEALSILKYKYKQDDTIVYLHMMPFNGYWLEGWNLTEIARSYNVENEVFFHPNMTKRGQYVPETTGDAKNPGLVEMYHASDLFVLPSQVEGFGLPIAEAMACGVPVAVTQYAAGWEVASPAGKGLPILDWEVHKSGTRYANVDTYKMADVILRLKRNPNERARMSKLGLERVKDFDWDVLRGRIIPMLEDAVNAHEASRVKAQKENQGEDTLPKA